jgi:hypothetical protein
MERSRSYLVLLLISVTLWLTACVTVTTEPLDLDQVRILSRNRDQGFVSSSLRGEVSPSVVAGDFNGDGRSDLAIVSLNPDRIRILLGNGDGTFVSNSHLVREFPDQSQ